jgi:hypothetical protein
MTTALTIHKVPTPTPQHDKSLSRQELSDHRAQIASEVKIVLSAYFLPHEAEEIRAGQLAWWCDELQEWAQEQIVWALRQWNRDNPRARPTPGDIVAMLKIARGRKEALRTKAQAASEPEAREPLTPEQTARMAEAGNRAVAAMKARAGQ